MRQHIVILLAVLLVACGDNPTNPPESTADQLRVINGPATCDACNEVEFTVAGPGLSKVFDASLKHHATGADVATTAEIRHFVGDSGPVLQIKLDFEGSAPKGDYDLRLHTVETGGAQASLNIPAAVKIIASPIDPDSPPPPPGPTGTVRVTTITSGPVPSVQYRVTVDPCDPVYTCAGRMVNVNGNVSIQLNPGSYGLALANVPANCTVTQPRSVTVTVVTNQIVPASFSVTCAVPVSGSIRVNAPTTGAIPGSPYNVTVSPCDLVNSCIGSVAANGTVTIKQIPGSYTVSLTNVLSVCTVADPYSVAVTVTASQTVDVSFSVTCPPAGTLRVAATVTGPDPDESFIVLEGECDWYYDDCNYKELSVGGSAVFSLVPGTYSISLNDVAANCSVEGNPRSVTVVANQEVTITFAVTCVANTTIRVRVPTTGPDADSYFQAELGDCTLGTCTPQGVEPNGFTLFFVPAGTYSIRLAEIAPNCAVTGPNPVVVTTTGASVTEVIFQVTCTALPVVRVTAPTTGTNPDASYSVVNESSCDYYNTCDQQVLPAAGAAEFKVTPGSSYVFRLIDIASNCTVTGPNPATVHVVAGVNTELAFPVTCQ